MHGHLTWERAGAPAARRRRQLELRGGFQRTETTLRLGLRFDQLRPERRFALDTSSLSHEHVADARWSGTALGEQLEWQTSPLLQPRAGDAVDRDHGLLDGQRIQEDGVNVCTIRIADQDVENKSYGAALHGSYHFGDAVTLGLGGRWIKDRKESTARPRVTSISHGERRAADL